MGRVGLCKVIGQGLSLRHVDTGYIYLDLNGGQAVPSKPFC
jgi:hypothetical protein